MDTFNLKNFLIENKLTYNSKRIQEHSTVLHLYTFGYDLENIEEVQQYLENSYEEGVDYGISIGIGDDVMNGFEVYNPEMLQDRQLLALIANCDGQGSFEDY